MRGIRAPRAWWDGGVTLSELWLIRHGESAANVAAARAEAAGVDRIDIAWRDADVPLTGTGREQAAALVAPLARRPPDAVWSSPYLRTRQTIELALPDAASGRIRFDERLRDRELGVLDLLTRRGVERHLPDEAARKRRLGKLYYRPPGGESWADVAQRLRAFLRDADADAEADGGTALLAVHEAIVWLAVFVCTGLDEAALFDLVAGNVIANASITRLVREGGGWRLEALGETGHLERQDAPVTRHEGERSDVH
jgi:broad specificity phosphatase PhoE